jgi:hypothetical protein
VIENRVQVIDNRVQVIENRVQVIETGIGKAGVGYLKNRDRAAQNGLAFEARSVVLLTRQKRVLTIAGQI